MRGVFSYCLKWNFSYIHRLNLRDIMIFCCCNNTLLLFFFDIYNAGIEQRSNIFITVTDKFQREAKDAELESFIQACVF